MPVLDELAEYMRKQVEEAERSAAAYRAQAAQCYMLRLGLEASLAELRRRGVRGGIELFVVERIAEAAKAETDNLKNAAGYDAEAERCRDHLRTLEVC